MSDCPAPTHTIGFISVKAYLGEGTVVPEVALVGEAVADVAQLALLGVLLDGVEELLLGDLRVVGSAICEMETQGWEEEGDRTSCLALVQRGISTTMFRTVFSALA